MASGSQSDTSLWLHNKLGTSNDSWTGGSIVSQLTPEILVKIQHCFMDLQPQVKLKLLLSLFHIQRRNLEAWKSQLDGILAVAKEDSEPWVCMLAELIKTFPETGQLCSDVMVPESNRKIFFDLLSDLKKGLKRSADKQSLVLPLECHYLNKNAFLSVVGSQPQTAKHFSLRRKPKAAALRAELMHKSQDAQNKLKASGGLGAFPIRKATMPRKMSDMPMKGLSSRALGSSSFNRNPRVPQPNRTDRRKEVGVKLLEITDQPLGYAAMKKKRKQEMEDAKKLAAEAEAAKAAQVQAEKVENSRQSKQSKLDNKQGISQKTVPESSTATPDYAAGLSSLNPSSAVAGTNQINSGSSQANQLQPPAYAPPTPTPINIQSQSNTKPSYAPPAPSSMAQQITTIIRPSVTGPAGNLNPLPPPPQLQPASTGANVIQLSTQQPPPLLVMQQTSSQQSSLLSHNPTTSGTISSNLTQQQKLQQQQAEILARAQQQLQQQAAAKGQNTSVVQPQLRAGGQQQLPFGIKSLPQQSNFQVANLGNLEPLPPSAIQQQPGATLPTQRQGTLRSTAQPQLPQQPLPPETALQQTSVRLPQQPVSTVVTRLSQPSGPNTAARIVQLPTQPIPQNTVVQMQRGRAPVLIGGQRATILQQNSGASVQQGASTATRVVRPVSGQAQQPGMAQAPVRMVMPPGNIQPNLPQQSQQASGQQQVGQGNANQQGQVRRSLTLTKDQMMEAQEMFATANKVTRPEKALILGFMAGSRENPCPHLGNVVTIKLSENQENVLQTDGTYLTMIVETHFQMNYLTGEWKRIKKYRRLEEA